SLVGSRLAIQKPEIAQAVSIRIEASAGAELKGLSRSHGEGAGMVQDGSGRVVGFLVRLGRPTHTRREVILEVVSPSPERGRVAFVRFLAPLRRSLIFAGHGRRVFVNRIGPDWT